MPVKQRQAECQPHAIFVMRPLGSGDHLFQPFTQQPVPDVMHGYSLLQERKAVPSPSATTLSTTLAITPPLASFLQPPPHRHQSIRKRVLLLGGDRHALIHDLHC
jgi:hypothetical protein